MKFLYPELARIATETKNRLKETDVGVVPMTLFAKGSNYALEALSETDYDVLSIDWTIDPAEARARTKGKTLQGNLDPCVMYGSEEVIQENVTHMMNG